MLELVKQKTERIDSRFLEIKVQSLTQFSDSLTSLPENQGCAFHRQGVQISK